MSPFSVEKARSDFPALSQKVHGRDLIFLDSAASSQTPRPVVETIRQGYEVDRSNIHRGVHALSQRATQAYEDAREKLRGFINAEQASEIVFTAGTTDGINLVAHTYGVEHFGKGDNIVVSESEHHANIVPWQMLAKRIGFELRVAPIDDDGDYVTDALFSMVDGNTKLVCLGHVSNALGAVHPIKDIIAAVRKQSDALVLIDGAQAVPHMKVDVRDLDADFYVFSGHKIFGPTGIGVLYGKAKILADMPPWKGGGDMIDSVSFEGTTFAPPPSRFEAGTPNIVGAVGLGAAVDYMNSLDFEAALAHEEDVVEYAVESLSKIDGLRLIGTPKKRAGVVSFLLYPSADKMQPGKELHAMDVGTLLDKQGIAVRTGHHCAEPLMHRLGVQGTIRASFSFTNTKAEVDKLVEALSLCKEMLA